MLSILRAHKGKHPSLLFLLPLFPVLIAGAAGASTHTYEGDQIYSSTKNAQSITVLAASNNSTPFPSLGGVSLRTDGGDALLPSAGLSPATSKVSSLTEKDQISVYVVREGDTLSQIAEMFDVSMNTIIWANDIEKGVISPGDTLTILPITGVRHVVEKGDTLSTIAEEYEGELEEIAAFNDLAVGADLAVGDEILIPNGEFGISEEAHSHVASGGGTAAPAISADGYFIRPVNGRRTQGLHGYNGIDFGAPTGSPIFAAAAGSVLVSKEGGWSGGYGNYVVIKHGNGTQTLYAHNSSNIVSSGQTVVQGQVIGYVGNTGRSTGPHLHFEVRGAKNPF